MKGDYTKAKNISDKTKEIVLKRQDYKSITNEPLYNQQVDFHHVLPRSSGGVGYEWNIVALTRQEHREYHDKQNISVRGRPRYTWQELEILMHNRLKRDYVDWSIDKCKYHKYWKEEDYGIMARKR